MNFENTSQALLSALVYDGLGYSRPGDYLPGLNESGEQLEDAADAAGLPFDQRVFFALSR